MKITPLTISRMTLLLFVFSVLFSCSKDTDLLVDAVLYESEVSIEDRNYTEIPAEEEGFVFRTYTFSPTYDAYIQDGQGYNYDIVRLQEDERTSYLMFDLSQIDGPITDAVLQFNVDSDEGDGDIRIHQGSVTDWTENNLSVANAPQLVSEVGSMNKAYLVGDAEKIALNTNNITSERTTLILSHQKGNDLAFASKEHPRNIGPKLIVTYKTAEDTPAIEQEEVYQEEEVEEVEETPQPKTDTPTPDYYVTTNGKASNDGKTEATAWNIEHAFERAVAGDVVYIKSGNYGNINLIADNSGTPSKIIRFIGYSNVPGDIISQGSSTFNYGDNLDANKMPLIKGNNQNDGLGIDISESYVEIHNMQLSDHQIGVVVNGEHVLLKNIVTQNNGEQSNNSIQGGRGFQIYGDYSIVEDCFSLNSNSEGINLKGTNHSIVKGTKVYSDNHINPGGYYIAITFGGSNNIIENCTIYRDEEADVHRGHGYILKDRAANNIIRNSKAYNVGIEVNFSGVQNNTFKDIELVGSHSRDAGEFSSGIRIINGAKNNTFEDIVIEDSRYAINFHDFDDGFAAQDANRDEQEGGHENKFIRLKVNLSKNIIGSTSEEIGPNSFSNNNTFFECSFNNITGTPFYSYMDMNNTQFEKCIFENISSNILVTEYKGGSFPLNFIDCTFQNVGFSAP